jgi:hypothetical protein
LIARPEGRKIAIASSTVAPWAMRERISSRARMALSSVQGSRPPDTGCDQIRRSPPPALGSST